jgi:hypothetical protein
MARGRRPPSQGCKTFLHNHADGIALMDLFMVPTISFRLLYGLLILHHDRRQILWLGVTAHPTAEWISRQLTEAYGWKVAPRYIIRDRDAVYGDVFIRRLRAMGIRDRPTAPRSPWQNGYCERAIGSKVLDSTSGKWIQSDIALKYWRRSNEDARFSYCRNRRRCSRSRRGDLLQEGWWCLCSKLNGQSAVGLCAFMFGQSVGRQRPSRSLDRRLCEKRAGLGR